jgi:putative SOS response-associated peptidase YedK
MCATYDIFLSLPTLEMVLHAALAGEANLETRVVPHRPGPVILSHDDTLTLENFSYSLMPPWLTDPKPKFSTYNARIETLATKPTWKVPLIDHHCVVPITGFLEAVYEGSLAGNMVRFQEASDQPLLAAGLWSPARAGLDNTPSYAIVTSAPYPQIEALGHDRSPLFLDAEGARNWMEAKGPAREMAGLLSELQIIPTFHAVIDRPLRGKSRP